MKIEKKSEFYICSGQNVFEKFKKTTKTFSGSFEGFSVPNNSQNVTK